MDNPNSASVENLRYVEKVLHLILDHDLYSIYWRRVKNDLGGWDFLADVNCNDFFFWGTSDAEDLPEEKIPELEQAIKDCEDVVLEVISGRELNADDFGPLLYCARQRRMRPQGAAYSQVLPEQVHYLFDACGPAREVDFVNPYDRAGKYLYTREEEE